ncbi:MAG: TrmH family RNA methyltransferase [Agriterribacter sp.]
MLSKSRVKYIQSLYHKKFRDEAGVYIVEGPKVLAEFLHTAPANIQELYCLKTWLNNNQPILNTIKPESITVVEEHELQRISALSTPNQVLAVVVKNPLKSFLATNGITLMLDNIQDPGNMGTIVRIADWFGVNTIVCSQDCVDIYNPKVIQSTMGSILRVNTIYQDLEQTCSNLAGVEIYAATLHGQSLYTLPPATNGLLLIGNESKGIKQSLLSHCTTQITIPRIGEAESLNAAVATGILLSHLTKPL